jgi:polysaccharide export outer membrane protein
MTQPNQTSSGRLGCLRTHTFALVLCAAAAFLCSVLVGCKSPPEKAPLGQSVITGPNAPVKINSGDVLQITFPGAPQMNTTERVRLDGKILLPLVGELVAAGKTPSQLQDDIVKLYDTQLEVKEVVVIVASTSASIFVTGAVARPGRIPMERPMTVLDAIMEAGGFDPKRASLRKVAVIRQVQGKYTRHAMDLRPVLNGRNVQPFWLQPFDTVYVPERLF